MNFNSRGKIAILFTFVSVAYQVVLKRDEFNKLEAVIVQNGAETHTKEYICK